MRQRKPRARTAKSRDKWAGALLFLILSHPISAQQIPPLATDITPGQMQTGSLLLRMKSGYVVATQVNTEIEAQVSGLVARVSVRQVFRNGGQEWVEGVYVFPLPDDAAVDQFRMNVGERIVEGEIREKQKARKNTRRRKPPAREPAWLNSSAPICLPPRSPTSAPARLSRSKSNISKHSATTRAVSA